MAWLHSTLDGIGKLELSRLGYLVDMKHVLVRTVVYSKELGCRVKLVRE